MEPPHYGLQSLLKGDTVLSLKTNCEEKSPSWTNLILSRIQQGSEKENQHSFSSKFGTGTVILTKEWRDSNFDLSIKWENGRIQKLFRSYGSKHVAFCEKVFVLDRPCIEAGSRVCLPGHPEIQGMVTEKRYLVTGRCFTEYNEDEEVIFEDVDVKNLCPLPNGGKLTNSKILYGSEWIGIIVDFKLRLQLKVPTRPPFSLVLDASIAEKYNVGEKIILGYKLLKSGRLVGNAEFEQNHWLVNTLIFWNVTATITEIETEELHVNWIGKAGEPTLYSTSYYFPNAPPTVIPYDALNCVRNLTSEKHLQVAPNTLWMYNHNPDVGGKDLPISKPKWISKWMKLVDWDRWEYPAPKDLSRKYEYWDEDLTLQVISVRSVVEVIWKSGIVSTLNSGDVVPLYLESVWNDWATFRTGVIVKDRLEEKLKDKYGVILNVNEDETAKVKWVMPGSDKTVLMATEMPNVPLFNLEEMPGYDFVSRTNQSPIVKVNTVEREKIGVVIGVDSVNAQVRVKFPGLIEKLFWPHQLSHYQCDLFLCPIENRPAAWYDHIKLSAELSRFAPNGQIKCDKDKEGGEPFRNWKPLARDIIPRKSLTKVKNVPEDNIFAKDMLPARSFGSFFFGGNFSSETEINYMERKIPDGMWIEVYSESMNIMSSLLIGPKDSIFEDIVFVFDVYVGYLNMICFRSMGITILPGHICKTGGVYIPEKPGVAQADYERYFIHSLLELKAFLGLPIDVIHEMDAKERSGFKKKSSSEELLKFVLISMLDYTLAVLRNPPKNWENLIYSHYEKALPRIINRLKQDEEALKKTNCPPRDGRGDLPKLDLDGNELNPAFKPSWSDSYRKSLSKRLLQLEKISEALGGSN